MTKQERLAGNRLIGEFAGKSFQLSHISDYKGCPDDFLPPMKYHHDWSWLMPVWYRFRDLLFESPRDQFNHSYYKDSISHLICFENIQAAYEELCNAIEWYNTTK